MNETNYQNRAVTKASMLFSLYIVLSILLPAGSIFGINVKIPVFIPLTIIGLQILATQATALLQFSFSAMVVGTATLWAIPSLFNPFYGTLSPSQYKDVLTTLIGCQLVRLFTSTKSDRAKFIRLCIYTVAFGGLLKILITFYAFLSGASISDLVGRISAAFGVTLMSIDLDEIGGRLQFPSDNILPLCTFVIFGLRKKLSIRPWVSLVLVLLLVTSSMYTFSRFIWASAVLAACLGMLVSGKDKMRWIYLGGAAAILVYFLPALTVLFELRFSSTLATESDAARVQQVNSLKQFFLEAPFFGHGMGSYPIQYKRSFDVPYAYEIQIMALFGEFGLVGMGLFGLIMMNYYRKAFSFRYGIRGYQIAVFLMLLDFLAGGFFNPCLLVSFSAVSYGLIFALAGMGSAYVESH